MPLIEVGAGLAPTQAPPRPSLHGETQRLNSHLRLCQQAHGRWARLAGAAQVLKELLQGHRVTVALLLAAALYGLYGLGAGAAPWLVAAGCLASPAG